LGVSPFFADFMATPSMLYKLVGTRKVQKAQPVLPRSKSLSHRALICASFCDALNSIKGLSESTDTRILYHLLSVFPTEMYVADAGTPARFLTARACLSDTSHRIYGTPRMQQRPMGALCAALRQLGAHIEGDALPLQIIPGSTPLGNTVEIDVSQSSQFLSALLLIGPELPHGLHIKTQGNRSSAPYVEMTLKIMKHYGASVETTENTFFVAPGGYRAAPIEIEPDWSAAAVWYGLVAIEAVEEVEFDALRIPSWQGDSCLAQLGELFGITTQTTDRGVRIFRSHAPARTANIDFTNCPDLAIALIYTAGILGLQGWRFNGLENLDLKESERLQAIIQTLENCGLTFSQHDLGFAIRGATCPPTLPFEIFQDHRLAMGAALWAANTDGVIIHQPDCVSKSYPHFWRDLNQAGISLLPL
jgi:3-phosphoshikimate 1-carboxyvinyltransferase